MKRKGLLTNYFKAITAVARQGDGREESYYSCLQTLVQQFSASSVVDCVLHRAGATMRRCQPGPQLHLQ